MYHTEITMDMIIPGKGNVTLSFDGPDNIALKVETSKNDLVKVAGNEDEACYVSKRHVMMMRSIKLKNVVTGTQADVRRIEEAQQALKDKKILVQ